MSSTDPNPKTVSDRRAPPRGESLQQLKAASSDDFTSLTVKDETKSEQ